MNESATQAEYDEWVKPLKRLIVDVPHSPKREPGPLPLVDWMNDGLKEIRAIGRGQLPADEKVAEMTRIADKLFTRHRYVRRHGSEAP